MGSIVAIFTLLTDVKVDNSAKKDSFDLSEYIYINIYLIAMDTT